MRTKTLERCMLATAAAFLLCVPSAAARDEAHLMRFADVHGDAVVFTYEDDLWTAPSAGGYARRLTSHPGSERHAAFSPDGSTIAFTGEYDGGVDVYVMSAEGGVPMRLTWHPSSDRVLGWHPSGDSVLFRSRREYPYNGEELYLVPVDGGLPRRLPVDRAGLAALSPDGSRIAYNRISREERTWKRYRGGMAQDLWLGRLDSGRFERVTDWDGTDNYPMWIGDAIYFTSDREHGTLNLYRLDPADGSVAQLTDYRDYDVKYPSAGPDTIVFQYGETLHLLDVATGEVREVGVRIASDRVPVRPELVPVADQPTGSFRLSPDGSDLLLETRGEVLVVPAAEDSDEPARNLTRSSGSREKNAVFSPDGTKVALLSDRSGDEELWLLDLADGDPRWRQLTDGGVGYKLPPVFSPDGRWLLFADRTFTLTLVEVDSGAQTVVDRSDWDDAWYRWGIQDYVFSPDSRWIAYSKLEESLYESIFLYSVESGGITRVTDPQFPDWSPSFDPEGRYLYFLSGRTFEPIMGLVDQNHVFLNTTRPYLVVLEDGAPSPFAPRVEDEAVEGDDAESGDDEETTPEVRIDLDGIGMRIVAVEGVEPGRYFRLEATGDGFLYLEQPELEFLKYQQVNDRTRGRLTLWGYDLTEESASELMTGVANYHLSGDGAKLAYRAGSKLGVVDAGEEASAGDGAVDLGDVTLRVDRLAEFGQIFDEAWRIQRDFFYDPGMHGVDWEGIRAKYRRFIPFAGDRSDLNYLIGEMISELAAGHTYVGGGDLPEGGDRVRVGLLGADLVADEDVGRYRIDRIVPSVLADPARVSPLDVLGCGIEEGQWLVSIDGEELTLADNPYRLLEDAVGRPIEVTASRRADGGETVACTVEPIGSEYSIRYREWVEDNRRRVDELSGGRVGYVHLPNMMADGLIEFARAFYPEFRKKAFLIDARYNGGGFVGDMIIDRLERELWNLSKPRVGGPIPHPERAFHGHLAVLVNADTGSNGEYFAEAIQRKDLATVIGTRTWGGAVGIEPHQDLVDLGVVTPPQFAPYGLDGGWLIEGWGVEPDIVVSNPPEAVLAGADPQLEAGVDFLLDRIEAEPMELPAPPPYPDKARPGEAAGGR